MELDMRNLQASELTFVYGAGGGGKSCKPSPCGKGGSTKKHSTKKHNSKCGTRGNSGGSKRCG
jgi:hypothetical protein